MKVLVAYATRHGATHGIAERIGTGLRARGLDVVVHDVNQSEGVAGYDAYVIGSAAYMFHWLREATAFVRQNRSLLGSRPTWLFSSGPLGTDEVDAAGRDVRVESTPREFAELRAAIQPRDEHVFFGAWDPTSPPIGLAERLTRLMPAARDALPAGDFRDWDEIDDWAGTIADELEGMPAGAR